jgi:hypothetical protein
VAEGLASRAQKAKQISPHLDPRAMGWVMLALHYGLNVLAVLDPEVDLERCKQLMLSMTFGGFDSGRDEMEVGDPSRNGQEDG